MPTTAEDLALLDVDTVLKRAAERLSDRFTGVFSPETIDRYVHESYVALFRTAKVQRHLPALAEHFATDRLTALAHAKGAVTSPVPQVLFLCVANAGRSQMAAALSYRASGTTTGPSTTQPVSPPTSSAGFVTISTLAFAPCWTN